MTQLNGPQFQRPRLKSVPADQISDDFKAVGEAIKGAVHDKFNNQPKQRPTLKIKEK
jgi:hypothetical protein